MQFGSMSLNDAACLLIFNVHFIFSVIIGQFVKENLLSFISSLMCGSSGQCVSSKFCEKFKKIMVKVTSSCR